MAITTYQNTDEKYIIHYTLLDSNLALKVEEILKNNQDRILNFFGRESMDVTRVYIFSSIKELRKYLDENNIYSLENQPDYLCACERRQKMFLASNRDPYFKEYTQSEYENVIIHEFVHLIEDKLFPEHPEWLSEGLAAILTNKYNEEELSDLINKHIDKNELPNIKCMKDKEFCTNKYDGYLLSYLMVKYLKEIFSEEEFIELLKQKYEDRLQYMDQKILEEAINYYKQPDINQNSETIKK